MPAPSNNGQPRSTNEPLGVTAGHASDRLLLAASRLYAACDTRSKCVILSLHRIGDGSPLCVDDVARHFEYLLDHYEMLLPAQLLASRSRSRRAALVTVDDCHECLYAELFPLARRMGVPLAVSVPTDFVLRGRWLWFDRLAWALRAAGGRCVDSPVGAVDLRSPASVERFVRMLKTLHPSDRDARIGGVLERLGIDPPEAPPSGFRPTTAPQLQEMLSSGLVEICSHTVTHPIVTHLGDEELADELGRSKAELEQVFGSPVTAFCYPNGEAGDFDERTRRAVQAAGYRMAFTSIEGVNYGRTPDWLALRRIHAHPRPAVFAKLASGLGDVQRRWRRLQGGGRNEAGDVTVMAGDRVA